MFCLVFLSTIVAILGLYYFWVRRNLKYSHQFNGPVPLPFIGTLYLLFRTSPEGFIDQLHYQFTKYGPLVRHWVGNRLGFLCASAKETEFILSSPQILRKNVIYDILRPWLGTGLLLSSGKKWHDRRKILTPAFHFKILEQFVEVFDKHSSILVQQMSQYADGHLVNIYPLITNLTLDILCETSMGTQLNAQTDRSNEYVKSVNELSYLMAVRFGSTWKRLNLLYHFTYDRMKRDKAIQILQDFSRNIIQKRRKTLLEASFVACDDKSNEEEFGEKKRLVFLDVLLQSKVDGQYLTDEEVQEEVDTFMFEGHDTTTICISFTLFLLAKNPEVQDKVYSEILDVLGTDPESSVTQRNLHDLRYLDLVIKESLRLYPPVPFIGRHTEHMFTINDKIVPEESSFNILIYNLHRNPDIFKNPEEFDPERFNTSDGIEKANPYSYIPFSAGPRNCIGQKFAMLEMKSTISKILRHYELTKACPDPKLMMLLTLKPKNSVLELGFKKRIQ